MAHFFCKLCGAKFQTVWNVTTASCSRHPDGPNRGKHTLYEGSEKKQYTCKYCGNKFPSLFTLTAAFCCRHPDGANKGKHSPAL